ncbi:hypothetical protein, partial, partial [Parasitella parasitica]
DRCLRIQGEPQNEGVLELPARPRGDSNRYLPAKLAEEGAVSPPSVATNSTGHPQDQEGTDPLDDPGNPRVAEPVLMANGDSTQQIPIPQADHIDDLDLDRLGVIRRFQEAKLGMEAVEYLLTRESDSYSHLNFIRSAITSPQDHSPFASHQLIINFFSGKKRSAPSLPNVHQENFDIAIINAHV